MLVNFTRVFVFIFLVSGFALIGCARSPKVLEHADLNEIPEPHGPFFVQEGKASWYGPGFHGRKTANGEVFNQQEMTCAHRTLPFGAKLKVTNLDNDTCIIVRVNDRGPYVGKRIVDLSKAAAELLDIVHHGIARVRLEWIE